MHWRTQIKEKADFPNGRRSLKEKCFSMQKIVSGKTKGFAKKSALVYFIADIIAFMTAEIFSFYSPILA